MIDVAVRTTRRRRRQRERLRLFLIIGSLMLAFALEINGVIAFEDYLSEELLKRDFDSFSIFSGEEPAVKNTEWNLILVNEENPLPVGYEFKGITLKNNEIVDERIYPALQKMFDDMRAEGIYPVVASGYRSKEEQQAILDEKIQAYRAEGYSDEKAVQKAREWVALPGTSEHETGLAVDINAENGKSEGDEVYEWLKNHAHEYGFIKRYPQDKTQITGISNEPWHYRYVGEAAAEEMTEKNLCLEEYLKDFT